MLTPNIYLERMWRLDGSFEILRIVDLLNIIMTWLETILKWLEMKYMPFAFHCLGITILCILYCKHRCARTSL